MKKKLKIIYCICLLLISNIAFSKNLQFWQQDNINYKISNDFSLQMSYEARLGILEKYSILEQHFTPTLIWKVTDWLSIGPNYRYVLLHQNHHFYNDHRPGLDMTLSYKLDNFKFSNRSRFILRKKENDNPYFRYRNLSKVEYIKFQFLKPYISYELFFDDGTKKYILKNADKISSHWFTVGISKNLTDNLNCNIGYLLILNKDNISNGFKRPTNIILFTLNFAF